MSPALDAVVSLDAALHPGAVCDGQRRQARHNPNMVVIILILVPGIGGWQLPRAGPLFRSLEHVAENLQLIDALETL